MNTSLSVDTYLIEHSASNIVWLMRTITICFLVVDMRSLHGRRWDFRIQSFISANGSVEVKLKTIYDIYASGDETYVAISGMDNDEGYGRIAID